MADTSQGSKDLTKEKLKEILASNESFSDDANIQNILGFIESSISIDESSHKFADEIKSGNVDPNISYQYSDGSLDKSKTSSDQRNHEIVNPVSSLLNALPQFEGTLFDIVLRFYKINAINSSNDSFYMILKSRVQKFDVPFPSIQDTIEFRIAGKSIKRPSYKINYPTHIDLELCEDGAFSLYHFFNYFRKIDMSYNGGEDPSQRVNDVIGYYINNGYTFDVIVLINKDPILQDNPIILPKNARPDADKRKIFNPEDERMKLPEFDRKVDNKDEIRSTVEDDWMPYTWGINATPNAITKVDKYEYEDTNDDEITFDRNKLNFSNDKKEFTTIQSNEATKDASFLKAGNPFL